MSAPKHAITLFKEAETEWENQGNSEARKMLQLGIQCFCGFKGKLGELLCDPEDETPNNFWCPQCKGRWWIWS